MPLRDTDSTSTRFGFATDLAPAESLTPCRLTAIYDDHESRSRAMAIRDNVRRALGEDCPFEESWWKFSLVREPSLSAWAANDAAEADLLLFAFGSDQELTRELLAFNLRWAALRPHREGLLAVLHRRPSDGELGVDSLINYFEALARKAGREFLTNLKTSCGSFARGPQAPSERFVHRELERLWKPVVDEYYYPSEGALS